VSVYEKYISDLLALSCSNVYTVTSIIWIIYFIFFKEYKMVIIN